MQKCDVTHAFGSDVFPEGLDVAARDDARADLGLYDDLDELSRHVVLQLGDDASRRLLRLRLVRDHRHLVHLTLVHVHVDLTSQTHDTRVITDISST